MYVATNTTPCLYYNTQIFNRIPFSIIISIFNEGMVKILHHSTLQVNSVILVLTIISVIRVKRKASVDANLSGASFIV